MAHYISASVKRSKTSGQGQVAHSLTKAKSYKSGHLFFAVFLLLVAGNWLPATFSYAEVLERVVAYVNNDAITLSEFQKSALSTRKTLGNVSDSDIINSMINRIILLQEAKKMRLEAPDDDKLVQEYIDIKIKSAIIIREEDLERYFNDNSDRFKGQDYLAVRDEIEKYLLELETNKQLKKQIDELRAKADIKIQLSTPFHK